ncbi:antibiotic biosynthesis monooxygenase family protein [Metabacillus herbersteinensis]|uniref:Antibiotic biosynthesis monooxygenase family protein n=1 Tax=Metabacillus herbersteinensis TaxID=283816 RepID=A0ABV6GEE1_9BACI
MNFYMTFGTVDYLHKTVTRHPNEQLLLMSNNDTGILFHETEDNSIFKEPKRYEVIDSTGGLPKNGFAVLNNIPVSDEGRPLFETRFKERAKLIEKEPGFASIRVLRPANSDTYIILTFWDTEQYFKDWQQSQAYNQAHKKRGTSDGVDQKSIFPRPSYVTTYYSVDIE